MNRKFTFLTAAFVLLAFLAIPLGMRGQTRTEEVYSTCLFGSQYNSQSVGSYTATWTTTNGDFTWTIVNGNNNNNSWNYVKFGRKNNVSVGQITTGAAYSEAVTKVDLTIDAITAANINSIKLYTSSDNTAWTEAGSFNKSTGLQTVTLANPAVNLYYKIEFDCASGSSNGLVTVSKVEYYYNTGGANSPTITAEDVEIEYDATSGVIAYTVNNPVAGGTMSANTTSDWLTLGTVGTTVPFTCAANQGAIRTAVVTLTYSYGNDNVTKNVTVTQNADPNGPGSQTNPYTIAQARAAIDANVGTQGVYATGIVSAIPTAYSTQYSNITFNMVDEEGDEDFLQAYRCGGNEAADVAVGDIVVVYGNLTKYGSTYEFGQGCTLVSLTHPVGYVETPTFSPVAGTYSETQSVTISCETTGVDIYYTVDGTDPDDESTPYGGSITVSETTTIKAIAYDGNDNNSAIAIASYHINSQVSPYTVAQALDFADYQYPANGIYVHGIVSTAPTQAPTANGELTYYISDNGEAENQLEVYKGKDLEQAAFTAQTDIQVGDIVTIYGNVVIYGTTNPIKEFAQGNYLVSFERPVSTEPSITVTPNRVDVPFAEASGTLAVTYQNIEMELEPEIIWFESDGETQAEECDWILVDFNENFNVNYVIDANTGDARMAYMKIYGVDAELNDVYSDLITFSQGHYFADYATLPFAFDGGRADIANTDGLTADGLGTDYNNSPKLKFDSSDDWMILHFEGTPGTLTFDIKGNSFSGGTFTVQTSEDGETYTDLATYSELGAIQHELFNNLGENVRYIKWIYTEKVSGNVALGNIKLYEEGGGPAPEASIIVAPASVSATAEETTGTLTVTYENISEIVAEVYFCDVNGEAATYDWIDAEINASNNVEYMIDANEGEARTAYLKVYALDDEANNVYSNLVTITQAAYVAPIEPVTYTLATTIESGKTYIIVGCKTIGDETTYYAMGEQRNNNRAGVAISVDGTTATVETADVHEVVITALEENGFYSIYDGGYLYAAGVDKNYLRTQDTLDVNAQWSISIDTLFHIVADSSLNRNVMQFNYNNGSPIFSCYGSASQSPVYLYVKEETPTTVTQTIELEAGLNWISFNVETDLAALKDALVATGNTNIVIYAKNASTTWNGRRWMGTISDFSLTQMYKISVPAACEIALEGMLIDPAELPITINPGANWIAFPLTQSMSLGNAFNGFPANQDEVTSKTGSSTWNGRRWLGALQALVPGQGYIYNSKATESKTLIYPTSSKSANGQKALLKDRKSLDANSVSLSKMK